MTTSTKPGPGLTKLIDFERGQLAFRYVAEDPENRVPEFVTALMRDPEIRQSFATADLLAVYVRECLAGNVVGRGAASIAAKRAAAGYRRA